MWVTISVADINEKPEYSQETHQPVKMFKRLPWLVCKKCGLMYLNNSFTRWCIDKGCNYEYHSGYKAQMHKGV